MKNIYEETFDELHLKDDHKNEILHCVLQYNPKQKRHLSTRKSVMVVTIALLLVVCAPLFYKTIQNENMDSPYVIKANDDTLSFSNDEIKMKDYRPLKGNVYISGSKSNFSIGRFETDPTTFPLSVYIEGEGIESISYKINNGEFYKINESEESSLEYTPCADCFGYDKKANSFPALTKEGNSIPGDETKPQWWYYAKSRDGNEITIPYEDQNTVNGFYGISFIFYDRELANRINAGTTDESNLYYNILESKMIEYINNSKLDVRINYKNGTFKVTQLYFNINQNNDFEIKK